MTVLEYYSGKIEAKLNKGAKTLIQDVYLYVGAGETLALIGETGSGKTLLAGSIMKLLPSNVVSDGTRTEFCGKDISNIKNLKKLLGGEIAYIPQSGHECLNPSTRIKNQMFDGLKKSGIVRKERYGAAVKNLRAVGFDNPEEIMQKYPFELSGGMAQRVVVALATCTEAKLVICDEPTNGMDGESKKEIIKLIDRLFPSAGKILITHDITAAEKSDRIIVLCHGKVMEQGKTEAVLKNPKHPYTKALINSSVKNGMCETPKLRKQEGNCPFYARCELACGDCLADIKYRDINGARVRCALC